ncbi:undecaprenyl-diphosphatase [Devosia sp. UYZn731]|uniref:phosphatase PAP2 family protein n=1 Tax=Devosia sp. UYZn731 TaxID=3156345 RepID=UPI00339B2C7C
MKHWQYPAFGAVALLLGGFGILADEVSEGSTFAFDQAILLSLRQPNDLAHPIGPAWLAEAARDVTALGGVPVLSLVVLIAVLFLTLSHRRSTAMLLAASVASGAIVSTILKFVFDRPRPDIPGVAHMVSASFPSGHSALSAIVYLVLGVILYDLSKDPTVRRAIIAVALVLSLCIGLTRIYLGVHYPSDVVAGWSLGGAWAILSILALGVVRKRYEIPTEGAGPPLR